MYKILVGEPEGKRPFEKPRYRCEYDVRMSLRETEWEGVAWIHLGQVTDYWRALVNRIMTSRVP
jgi:hypothetical protein